MRNLRPSILLAATLAVLAAPAAFAQSELDRLEVATVASGENLGAFLVSRAPSLADVMPDWSWDADMRVAAACTLDEIRAAGGDDAVEEYISSMEAFSAAPITSLQQVATSTPVPISPEFAAETGNDCGTAAIAMERMQASGFMAAMSDPAIAMQFMGQ